MGGMEGGFERGREGGRKMVKRGRDGVRGREG